MLEYYRKNRLVSFGFVAAPDLDKNVKDKHISKANGSRRFRFYQRMMINLFGPETFCQVSDTTHTIYLLINQFQLENKVITLKTIEDRLNQTYLGEFTINV